MNLRSLLMLLARISPVQMFLFILVLSAGVTWLVGSELSRRTPAQELANVKLEKQKTSVLYATRNIEEGSTISAEDVAMRTVDIDRAPIDAVPDVTAAVGRSVKFAVAAGTILSSRDLQPLGMMPNGFQSKLREGERAITLAVDSTTGVAGFIAPDSHVDIMVQVGNGADTKTTAIMSDARVVATGTVYQRVAGQEGAVPASTVTVAVLPNEASQLINAMAAGRIYLTLRNDHDHTPIPVSDLSRLFHKPKPAPEVIAQTLPMPILPPPVEPKVAPPEEGVRTPMHEIELYAGSNRNVITTAGH